MSKLLAAFQKLLNSQSKSSATSNSLRNSSFTVVATHPAATARGSSMPPIPVSTGGPYHFSSLTSSWVPFTPSNEPHPAASSGAATPSIEPHPLALGSTLNLITWNIDFVAPYKQLRVHSILRYIRTQLSAPTYSSSTGTLILLQEIRNPVEGGGRSGIREGGMIHAILEHPWVREEFFLSNIVIRGRYGTATLVSRGIQMIPATPTGDQPPNQTPDIDSLQGCFRVASPRTIFDRDILVADLVVSCRNGENGILRICNTHLESLAGHGTEVRPLQLALGASLLRKEHVIAGIIAGDMNACEESDFTLIDREDVNLRDVWVEITGKAKALELDRKRIGFKEDKCAPEDPQSTRWGEEGGHTWGYQTRETEYFPRRLDKVLFCENERGEANVGLKWVEGVERLGINVKTSDVDGLENVSDDNISVEEGDEVWLSDHFGLLTKLVLTER